MRRSSFGLAMLAVLLLDSVPIHAGPTPLHRVVDLVCHFDTPDLDILTGSSGATVKGLQSSGGAFEGSDTINVVRDGCVSK